MEPDDPAPEVADLGSRPPIGASRLMASGAVLSAASKVFVTAAGAATTIVIARVLGSGGLGTYAVAQSLLAVLLVLTTMGVEHGIVYYVSSGRWDPGSAFRSSQIAALGCGLAGGVVLVLIRLLVPSALRSLSVFETVVVAAAAPFMLSWFYGAYVALAVNRYEGYVLPPAIQATLVLVLAGGLGALDGVVGVVIGLAAAHVLTAVAQLGSAVSAFGRHHTHEVAVEQLRRAVAFGIKGYGANALQVLNLRLDLLILGSVAARSVVGHYAVAVAATSVVWLLPQALGDVLYPRAAALSSSSEAEHADALRLAETKSLRHGVLAVVIVAVVSGLGLLILAVPVYGSAFRPAITLGLILLPGVAAFGLAAILSAAVAGRGHPELLLIQAIVVTPPTLVLYLVLIPSLHATGAALASTASYMASFVLVAVFFQRVSGLNPLRTMVPTRSELWDYNTLILRVGDVLTRQGVTLSDDTLRVPLRDRIIRWPRWRR